MYNIYFMILLLLLASCKTRIHFLGEYKSDNDSIGYSYDQSEGWQILDTLGKVYGNDPQVAGLSLETPNCPDFIEGIYFDKAVLVFQVTGDTIKARQELEKASGDKNFRMELIGKGSYSQKQLLAIKEQLSKKLEKTENEHIYKNVMFYGIGSKHIVINLIMNTPDKRKEFREKVMDSPAFRFDGVEIPIINEKVGASDTLGIYIRPEYPVYSTDTEQVTFILNNYSGMKIGCGEHYYITFEDEKGIWRELPMNSIFFDIGYTVFDKGERRMNASLNPDLHLNKPGRYRYFYKVTMGKEPILLMSEFQLTNNEKEWKEAKRTHLPKALLKIKQNGSAQLVEEEYEEPIYEVVEVMPEFPGGTQVMLDFIAKNIQYPEVARKNGKEGRVIVKIVIDKDGAVTEPTLVRGIDPYLDKEALRIVGLMPKWKPGTQKGKALKVEYTFPVAFKLAD